MFINSKSSEVSQYEDVKPALTSLSLPFLFAEGRSEWGHRYRPGAAFEVWR